MSGVPASSHGGPAFNGGTITTPLVIAPTNPASVPLQLKPAAGATAAYTYTLQSYDDAGNLLDWFDAAGEGGVELSAGAGGTWAVIAENTNVLKVDDGLNLLLSSLPAGWKRLILNHSGGTLMQVDEATGVTRIAALSANPITSGALSTVAPVSATAFQCSTTRDVFLTVPVTYNPGVATTATCKVELSPDNVTFSELVTITQPVGTVFDGSIEAVQLIVPAAWRVKLTVTNATLGTGTYY